MKKKPYPLTSCQFWSAYWITLRPYLMFVSGVSGLAGLAFARSFDGPLFWAVFLAFFVSYGVGQALTDVFQTDTDSISSPYRPLTSGAITKRDVAIVSLAGLGACSLSFLLANPSTLPLAVAGVVGLATYTPLKRRWWGGPFWNSWIVGLIPIIGYLCGGASLDSILTNTPLLLISGSVFFSYAIFVLLGYFKDISADRATGYKTFPVVFGWKPAVIMSLVYWLAASVLSFWAIHDQPTTVISLAFWLGGVGSLAFAHLRMWKIRKESDAHRSIAYVVRGYVLMHLGEAMAFRPDFLILSALFYIAFELVLYYRPERTQI